MAKVHSIHISDASMRPMRSVESAKLIAGKGIEGDRYATGEGTYVAFREPGRQLTLISKESAESHLAGLARGKVTVGNLRRNVVVSGMTARDLEDAIGSVLTLGDACRVRIHRLCVPCMYNEKLNQAPGLMEAVWSEAGVNCEILAGGSLRPGDVVTVEQNSFDASSIDDGGKKAAFYKRPSLRTEDEIESLRSLPMGKPGVDRIAEAYATVGANEAVGIDDDAALDIRTKAELRAVTAATKLRRRAAWKAQLILWAILTVVVSLVYTICMRSIASPGFK